MMRESRKKKVSDNEEVQITNLEVECTEPKKPCIEECNEKVENDIIITKKIFDEEIEKLKQTLRNQPKMKRVHPTFWLRDQGENAAISVDMESRVPLFVSDLQHLIMYAQIGPQSPYTPARWCQVNKHHKIKNTNVLIIENISLFHYISHESEFRFIKDSFKNKLEVVNPQSHHGDIVQELIGVPLTITQMKKFVNKFGTLENAVTESNEIFDIVRNMFPGTNPPTLCKVSSDSIDKFPRTHLLLSGWQMIEENYPLPIKGLMDTKYKDYVLTKDLYKDVTPSSPLFGVDCEMCMTTKDLELTRVSVVDEKFNVVYETLVKPRNKIVNYLTQFSGITPHLLKDVTKRLEDVQKDLRKILPSDAILVGQSLNGDMHALKMMHPYVIDTSIIFNITGERSRKTKLATLAKEFLHEQIQTSSSGHCSVEDSLASLKLVQLKLSKSIYFGDSVLSGSTVQVEKHPQLGHPYYTTCMLKQSTKLEKTACIYGVEEVLEKYRKCTFKNPDSKKGKKIKFIPSKAENVVNQVLLTQFQYSLNIAHCKLSPDECENDPDVFKKVDCWAKDLFDSSFMDTLNIIIFAGHNTSSGCCFIRMKW